MSPATPPPSASCATPPGGDLQHVIAAACEPVPAWDPVVYLGDFSGKELFPLTPGEATEDVAGSMAGRAFSTGQPVTSERDDGVRVWVPVSEQASRTGVLAVTIADDAPETVERVELLGVFAGLVIAAAARVSDVPYVRRTGTGDVAGGGHAVGPAAAAEHPHPGGHDRRAARARLRHRRRRVRLLDQRRSPGLRDHRRDGTRPRLHAADRARGRRLPARAPPRRLHHGHARGHRPGAYPAITTTSRSPPASSAGSRSAPGGWSGRAPGIRRRCCCAGARSSRS